MRIKRLSFLPVPALLELMDVPRGATQLPVTVGTLKQFVVAFNLHDLDGHALKAPRHWRPRQSREKFQEFG